jgi:hypothetical protein
VPSPDADNEVYERQAIRRGERAPVQLRITGHAPWRLEADGPTGRLAGEGPDLFEACVALRELLERDGWLLEVQGARSDTYPSGMGRGAGGQLVYVLRWAQPARLDDIVDTLAPLDDGRAATVAEQREYFERWAESL